MILIVPLAVICLGRGATIDKMEQESASCCSNIQERSILTVKKPEKYTKQTIWSQLNKKWPETDTFEYPSTVLPNEISLSVIDFWRNKNDVAIEGVQNTYTDGH